MPPTFNDFDITSQNDMYGYNFDESSDPQMNLLVQKASNPQDNSRSQNTRRASESNPQHIPFLDRLRKLPEVRSIPWRAGQELPPEKAADSPRVQTRGAILLATRGKAMEEPCSHCAAGYGRFEKCVTLETWFQGACSTCIFTSKANKCSLRCQTSGTADGRALRYHASNPDMFNSYVMQKENRNAKEGENAGTPILTKRKRRSEPAKRTREFLEPDEYNSHHQIILGSPEPDETEDFQVEVHEEPPTSQRKLEQTPPRKGRQDHILQDNSANRQNSPRVNLGREKQHDDFNYAYTNNTVSRGWTAANVRNPLLTSVEPVTCIRPTPQSQPIKEPGHHRPISATPLSATSARPSSSLTGSKDRDREQGSMPLIDSLSKSKQRQIYGLVSGLQGGLDHLQKQVDFLKKILEIDPEDEIALG